MKRSYPTITLGFSLAIISNMLSIHGQSPHTSMDAPQEKQTKFDETNFKNHMINHFNEGCPANSECTPKMGKDYQSWIKFLTSTNGLKKKVWMRDKFRKEKGIPFEIWLSEQQRADDKIIFWDSHCRSHNPDKGPKIRIGLAMVKHLNELKDYKENVYLRFIERFKDKGKAPQQYFGPRDETPLYLDGNELIYQRLLEGHTYGMSVSSLGALHIVPTISPKEFPQTIDCPENLVSSVTKKNLPKNLYSGIYCQRTYNIKTKKFETLLFGWSCN